MKILVLRVKMHYVQQYETTSWMLCIAVCIILYTVIAVPTSVNAILFFLGHMNCSCHHPQQ